jgi:hypothetical protein
LLQYEIAKFVSDPTPPPRLVDIPEEGNGKAKERREVGEGDDTITFEDTIDEEDGEMLQERFQLRSRFSRLAWRLVSLRRRRSRAMWTANVSPRS